MHCKCTRNWEDARTYIAGVAQLVEQLICNQQVGGSNPSASTSTLCLYEVQTHE